jgi:hypothetical protein
MRYICFIDDQASEGMFLVKKLSKRTQKRRRYNLHGRFAITYFIISITNLGWPGNLKLIYI